MMPEKIYRSTHAINAAFAMFWADRYGRAEMKAPYRFDFQKDGGDLLKIWHDTPDDPSHDHELVDGWADRLRLAGWYSWVPYQLPS